MENNENLPSDMHIDVLFEIDTDGQERLNRNIVFIH